jgi:hypothetical protein
MNKFLVEIITKKYCRYRANEMLLCCIVVHYDEKFDGECIIFSNKDEIEKYLVKQIDDKFGMYRQFIDRCYRYEPYYMYQDRDDFINNLKKLIHIILNKDRKYYYIKVRRGFIGCLYLKNDELMYKKISMNIAIFADDTLKNNELMYKKISMNIAIFADGTFRPLYCFYNDISELTLYIIKHIDAFNNDGKCSFFSHLGLNDSTNIIQYPYNINNMKIISTNDIKFYIHNQ